MVIYQFGSIIKTIKIKIEPGYYLEGAFGIRIENCLLIQKSEIKDFLKFENLSLVPYDLNLIDISLLQKEDILHINNYHKKVISLFLIFLYNLYLIFFNILRLL